MNASWRDEALCQQFPDLPWIVDPKNRSLSAQRAMEGVCNACPVFLDCESFAKAFGVTSGFYAGKDRTPSRHSRGDGRRRDGAA